MRRGLAATRSEAQQLIADGRVTVGGAPGTKPARQVTPDDQLAVSAQAPRWASRGGHKLAGALDALRVDPAGRHCLDAGASTGGFTDVLLRQGAQRVVAVDVGYGQLAWHLRVAERVVVLDRTNVRHLTPDLVPPPPPTLVVADLSFISLTLVLPALRAVAADDADHVLLVKPQFESDASAIGRGGVVRDPETWRRALLRVARAAQDEGLGAVAAVASELPGPSGNVEFFWHLRAGGSADPETQAERAVSHGRLVGDGSRGGDPDPR